MGSDGNYYVADTAWHSDGGHKPEDPMHLKIAYYLDPLTRDTGALRVIPGSHIFSDTYSNTLQQNIGQSIEEWGIEGKDVPAVALETQPGDVVCFNHNTKHSAFGGNTSRRMFTTNLCQRYPEDRLDDLRAYIGHRARFWNERSYDEKMISTAGPERMRHLEQCLENDAHLAALTQQARKTMAEPSRG